MEGLGLLPWTEPKVLAVLLWKSQLRVMMFSKKSCVRCSVREMMGTCMHPSHILRCPKPPAKTSPSPGPPHAAAPPRAPPLLLRRRQLAHALRAQQLLLQPARGADRVSEGELSGQDSRPSWGGNAGTRRRLSSAPSTAGEQLHQK